MTKPVKKNDYLFPFPRLFTRVEGDAYDTIGFQSSESFGDESAPALASPLNWTNEAVAMMAEAACASIPADLRVVEENTVPSWLWRHQSRGTRRATESDLRDIFNRVTGSAAAKAWKLGLFTSEKHARAFYDESRFALMQRHVAIAPDVLGPMGLTWAYGVEERTGVSQMSPVATQEISNAAIDGLMSAKNSTPSGLWKKLFTTRGKESTTLSLRLSDIAADWHNAQPNPARAAIDVLALRHNDGSVNTGAVRQATRLLTILLDLHDRADVTIGIANLSPLLLALGLGYDSDAGRALAASLAALITAECYATSAELSALLGASAAFTTNSDSLLRGLRNHRRAVYGDGNDYEKLSVLPTALPLKNCPDLSLAAEAQRRWDDALDRARAFGLRATQVTDLTPSPVLGVLMTCASQGVEPMQSLTLPQPDNADSHRIVLHPGVTEALARLDYPRPAVSAAAQHIIGMRSLRKAPVLNPASLRARGLNESALEKIEAYIPCVTTLRLAITPWIIGLDFCRTQLKIPARLLESPRFDLLSHWGFTAEDVRAADLYCYGHQTARNAKCLHLRHRPLFGCGTEIATEARLRMAAAVQSFISGNTGIVAYLPTTQSITRGAETTLAAWRSGLKAITLVFDPTLAAPRHVDSTRRKIKASAQPHAQPISALPRRAAQVKRMPLSPSGKKPASIKVV